MNPSSRSGAIASAGFRPAASAAGYLLLAVILGAIAQAQNLTFLRPPGSLDVRVGKLTEHGYALTRSEPIEFAATGPAWLRVYVRLLAHEELTGTAAFELQLHDGDGTRHVNLQAEVSPATRGVNGVRFTRWRSFYVRVRRGERRFRLELGTAGGDTAAVRIVFENPPAWTEVTPASLLPVCRLRVDSLELSGRVVADTSPVRLVLAGPLSLMVEARLNYQPREYGARSFTVDVYDGGLLVKSEKFQVRRQKSARYTDGSELVPSVSRRVRLDLSEGEHDMAVVIRAGKGRSAAVRFLTRERRGGR
jgi:hypothetical protein